VQSSFDPLTAMLNRRGLLQQVQRLLLGNSPWDWLIAGMIGIAVWSGLLIVRRLIASRYQKYSTAQQRLPIRLIAYLAAAFIHRRSVPGPKQMATEALAKARQLL